jgi:hypothetical protein
MRAAHGCWNTVEARERPSRLLAEDFGSLKERRGEERRGEERRGEEWKADTEDGAEDRSEADSGNPVTTCG